jgi:hypothetical protein
MHKKRVPISANGQVFVQADGQPDGRTDSGQADGQTDRVTILMINHSAMSQLQLQLQLQQIKSSRFLLPLMKVT